MQGTQQTDNCLVLHDGRWAFRGRGSIMARFGFGALFAVLDGHIHEDNAWVGLVVGLVFGVLRIPLLGQAAPPFHLA